MTTATPASSVPAARNAVATVFALNGLLFASLVSRIPDLRRGLDLGNGSLGLLLLATAAGSLLALPTSGRLVGRIGAASVVRLGAVLAGAGLVAAWLEPRTLVVGVMVLTFAFVEGSANDWLSLALIDGYDVAQWVGVAGFAVFVTAMTAGRLVGPVVLDRFGRPRVLWATAALSALGIVMVVHGEI